mmetsp:Transcript_12693/g.39948  ORF Transcript_12693/g.39948 Transcript_12693/m.39948 type:complete len:294 (-) Transcript_12693:1001-1882(-)
MTHTARAPSNRREKPGGARARRAALRTLPARPRARARAGASVGLDFVAEAEELLGKLGAHPRLDLLRRDARVPPAVVAHAARGGEEARQERVVVGRLEVEAEEAAARAHPRERDALRAQVVLEKPVVTAGGREEHSPHGRQILQAEREALGDERLVAAGDEVVRQPLRLRVRARRVGRLHPREERVHAAERERRGRKRADHVRDAHGVVGVEAPHQLAPAAHDAHRHATAERLAVHDDVRLHAVKGLRAARGHAEARVHFVEDQRHVGGGARVAQGVQPLRVQPDGLFRLAHL